MEDKNKILLSDALREIILDFDEICRFCLSETKSGISINDKCLFGDSMDVDGDSIFNFMTKLRFIKMENPNILPLQVCKNCCKLVQLCYDFNQICQKSDILLRECCRDNMNEIKEALNKSALKTSKDNEGCMLYQNTQNSINTFKNIPTVMDEINKLKNPISEEKLKDSINILDTYKQKLHFLSGRIKKAQLQLIKMPVTVNKNSNAAPVCQQPIYSCSECSLKFSNVDSLNFHYVAMHNQKKFRSLFKYQCKNCLKSFRDQANLRRHYKIIHKMSEIPNEYLNNKVKQIIEVDKRIFQCFHCVSYKEFTSQEELVQHLEDFHQSEQFKNISKLYVCVYCKKLTFPSKLNLKLHLLLVHKLKEDEIMWNDVKRTSLEQDSKHPSVLVCMKPAPPAGSESVGEPQKLTELSALLGVLNSVINSLSVAQQGKGFKVTCKSCNPPTEFTSANDFAQHVRTRHDESKLLENWSIKKKNEGWNCSECPATYSRKQTLHYHMKEKHKQTNLGGMKCPDCSETFATNRQLIQHGIGAHQKYFAYFHKVYKKILEPDGEEEECKVKNFECDVCQRKYIYKSSLRKHILTTHLGKSGKDAVVCPYCGKTISSKLNLKSHIEFVHEAVFVSCPICKKKINLRTIGKHYKTHRSTQDAVSSKNSFLCNLCGKILKSKRSFEDHQKLHKNIRDEVCDVCGSGFTTKKFLRLHKKTHEGVQRKTYGCEQCEKVFSRKHTLDRHLLTHSGEKNFICEICSKCFYTLQELNRHVRWHKKEYRFDCQLCDRRFLDKSRFRHHMMRHRNVRPHKCQFCEKLFIVKGKMNLHMATKHNFQVENTKGVWKDPKSYVPLDDLL